jgi:hypothetical protein
MSTTTSSEILSNYFNKIPILYRKFHSFEDIQILNEDNKDFKEMKNEFLSILYPFECGDNCVHSNVDYSFLRDENNFQTLQTNLKIHHVIPESIVDKMCVELHIRLCNVLTFEGYYEYVFNKKIVKEYQTFCCRCREHIGTVHHKLSRNNIKLPWYFTDCN